MIYLTKIILLAGLIFFFIFPFLLCTFGLIGNLLVLIAILIERRLQNTTNYFLFSLALADLLVCLVVAPFSLLAELSAGFKWTFQSCLFYLYTDVFLCSASICHMAVISLDRYLGISQPLKRHRNRKGRTVAFKIIFVWFLTIIISSPLAILSFIDNLNILSENECGIRSRSFMLYGSTFSFIIPVVVLTVTTGRTTNLLKQQAKMLSNKKGINELRRTIMPARKKFGRMDSNNLSTGSRGSQSGMSSGRFEKGSCSSTAVCFQQGGRLSLATDPPKRRLFQRQMTTPEKPERRRSSLGILNQNELNENFGKCPQNNYGPDGNNNEKRSSPTLSSTFGIKKFFPIKKFSNRFEPISSPSMPNIKNANSNEGGGIKSRKLRLTGSKKAHLANEQKATRVLIVQIVCFFVCWTPFFCQNIILGICGLEGCGHWFPSWFSLCALWFGYFSSVLNPIIYTIFNRRFRDAFVRIIQCHYWVIRHESGSTKFWPTMTEAAGINTTLNSICQKFSRKPASITRNNNTKASLMPRRCSYAGEVAQWENRIKSKAKRMQSIRRSTLMLPGEIIPNSERRFITRRISTTFLEKQSSMTLQINSSKLYTISDSDEDEISPESRSEENSRRPSKTTFEDASQFAKKCLNDLIRKVSWNGIGRSASSFFHYGHGTHFNENEGIKRKITPHILFPIEIHEILTLGTDKSKLNNNNLHSSPPVVIVNGNEKKKKHLWESGDSEEEFEGDRFSLNSTSIISTTEDFFALKINEIRSNQTAI